VLKFDFLFDITGHSAIGKVLENAMRVVGLCTEPDVNRIAELMYSGHDELSIEPTVVCLGPKCFRTAYNELLGAWTYIRRQILVSEVENVQDERQRDRFVERLFQDKRFIAAAQKVVLVARHNGNIVCWELPNQWFSPSLPQTRVPWAPLEP
jgi:hypothetical protein